MNKIIINPHNCSREDYKELVEYLENKFWDYREVKMDSVIHADINENDILLKNYNSSIIQDVIGGMRH